MIKVGICFPIITEGEEYNLDSINDKFAESPKMVTRKITKLKVANCVQDSKCLTFARLTADRIQLKSVEIKNELNR